MGEEYDYLFKMLLIGDSGVGKSCLLMKYADGTYSDSYLSTIGVDFKIKTEFVDGKIAKLQIWDTAGQERFRTITSSYYRGAHAIAIVFDLTNDESFANIDKWIEEVNKYVTGPHAIVLIGAKADAVNKRLVSRSKINEYAEKHGLKYIETSAKTGEGVNQAFLELCKSLIESNVIGGIRKQPNGTIKPTVRSAQIPTNRCC